MPSCCVRSPTGRKSTASSTAIAGALDRRDRKLLDSVLDPDSTHDMGGFVGPSSQFAFDVLSEL